MAPAGYTSRTTPCTCGGGTCACFWRGYNQAYGATTTNTITIYANNYGTAWPALDDFKKAADEARFKQGWHMEVAVIQELEPVKPRVERRAAPTPEIVGGGPMRRRWR